MVFPFFQNIAFVLTNVNVPFRPHN